MFHSPINVSLPPSVSPSFLSLLKNLKTILKIKKIKKASIQLKGSIKFDGKASTTMCCLPNSHFKYNHKRCVCGEDGQRHMVKATKPEQ